MIRVSSFSLLILFFGYGILYADEYYNFIKMTCDPSMNSVKLENIDQWNNRPSENHYTFKQKVFDENDSSVIFLSIYRDGECVFSNENSVRLRLGSDPVHAYGECGAAPAQWFSLWVNKKKILSRHIYIPRCNPGSIMKSVEIVNGKITINEYTISTNSTFLTDTDINKSEVLTRILRLDTNLRTDEIEYPLGGQKIPAGTKVLQYGFDNPVCQAFIQNDWNTKKEFPKPMRNLLAHPVDMKKLIIDINNDGHDEYVYNESLNSGEQNSIYVVDHNVSLQIDNLPSPSVNLENYAMVANVLKDAYALLLSPVNTANKGHYIDSYPSSYAGIWEQHEKIVNVLEKSYSPPLPIAWADPQDAARMTFPSIKKTINIPDRLHIIRYEGTIYLDFSNKAMAGILKYKSHHAFEEVCLATVVEENY